MAPKLAPQQRLGRLLTSLRPQQQRRVLSSAAAVASQEFAGRVALVTGGGRGIGSAICAMLAANGAKVAVNYVGNKGAAEGTLATVRAGGSDGIIVQGDTSDMESVNAMVATVRSQLGEIDLLVNNAGVAYSNTHEELTPDTWKRTIDVNVHGPFYCTWAVKDSMVERGYGRIVNISSIAASTQPRPTAIDYATSKAALDSFTRHVSAGLAPAGVRVNCVAPGLTATELAMSANPGETGAIIERTPLGRIGQPEEIAAAVRFCLSDDSSFMTGQTIPVDGGRT